MPAAKSLSPYYIYVVRFSDYCHKIGIASDVAKRIRHLQNGSPVKLALVHAFTLQSESRARRIESRVHHDLSPRRLSGEWFHMDATEAINAVTNAMAHTSHDLPPRYATKLLRRPEQSARMIAYWAKNPHKKKYKKSRPHA